MVEPQVVDSGASNEQENRERRRGKKWLIISIAFFALLILVVILLPALPYKDWAFTYVGCRTKPVLGIETKSNGAFGADGKVAVLPGDEGYDSNITSDSFFYIKNVTYYCNEQAAAEKGFVTHEAFNKVHPAPSYAMETPTFKAQYLIDRGYALDDEEISYAYGEWSENTKYPYYEVDYKKTINPERVDIYELTQFKIINTGSVCSTNLFLPHGDAVTPGIRDTSWQTCEQVGVLREGVPLYRGVVKEYGYSVYFANMDGTLVVVTRTSFPEIADIVQLFNSLVEYTPTVADHVPIYRRDRPIEVPY